MPPRLPYMYSCTRMEYNQSFPHFHSSPSVPDEEGQVGGHVRLPAVGGGPDGAHGAAAVRAVQDVHRVGRQPRRV